MPAPFHLAIPVDDLEAAREFYGGLLQCREGRSDTQWVDFDFFGHQLVTHRVHSASQDAASGPASNPVDGHQVPVPHFGMVLPWESWQRLADRLTAGGADFIIHPCLRFEGQPGEQATMFIRDPAGNVLEFKAMRDPGALFRK